MFVRIVLQLLVVLLCSPLTAGLVVTEVPTPGGFQYPYTYTGNGAGFMMGSFDVESSTGSALTLYSITLSSFGTGDDSTAFSEVGLFMDSNANGTYDPGIDTRYGPTYSAFPTNDGDVTFTQSVTISGTAATRFLLVVKLNGSVLPFHGQTFLVDVTSVSGTGGPVTGVPTGSAGAMGGLSPIGGPTPLRLEYSVSGSAPPYAYQFRLILDNHNGTWAAGQSWGSVAFGMAEFDAAGTNPFQSWVTNAASYPIGPYTTTISSGLAIGGKVFPSPALSGSFDWVPGAIGDQLTWTGTADVLLDQGEMTWMSWRVGGPMAIGSATLEPAYRVGNWLRVDAAAGTAAHVAAGETGGGTGFLAGLFTVKANGAAATLGSVWLQASGTGNDATAYSEIGVVVDVNGNGLYDPGVDSPFGPGAAGYTSDNGPQVFAGALSFAGGETKTFLIVAKLNGSAMQGQTFHATVTGISASGGAHAGLPTATMPGFVIAGSGGTGGKSSGDAGCATTASGAAALVPLCVAAWAVVRRRRKAVLAGAGQASDLSQ